jgi:putative membrane-bound dehydrogenase-like protein
VCNFEAEGRSHSNQESREPGSDESDGLELLNTPVQIEKVEHMIGNSDPHRPSGNTERQVFGLRYRGICRILSMFVICSSPIFFPAAQAEVAFEKLEGSLKISVDGKPFAEYVWSDPTTTRPYLKDVRALGGEVQLTRNHPPAAGDIQDHATFHPGIWWGFGDVGGNDYWRLKARIVGAEFITEPEGGMAAGHFSVRHKCLVSDADDVFCDQICRYHVLQRPAGILLVCECTLLRKQSNFWLGDQEEMGLAFRVASTLAVVSGKGGRILSSDGNTDLPQMRTQQSDWCDYSGPIAGSYGGMMLMNNPDNFRKPWWHAVDTGLLVANPLGESELSGRGKKQQNVLVKADEPFTLKYGVLVHLHANADAFNPADAYADYLQVIPTLEEKHVPQNVSQTDLPQVPEGFQVSVFAQEPLVYKPTSMCFDSKGRLYVGQGPQYPENYEDSPTDSVFIYIDSDRDGIADDAREFAKGFNSVQGLAWKGNDLYVANAPELTIVRDLDGDDQADEYVVVYTDLGNREHALHGLNWAPDGRLYMSKGNSKGHNQPEKTGVVAPRAFRELWDVEHPAGAPDAYPPQVFTKDTYRKTWHHWDDDWGREGGVLRCDPLGENLEIVARGLRNPWDITMDPGFNWLGTDNDQSQGDRIVMPFYGAHFGWGHPYSSHWSGDKNLPTVPVSGPLFPGSGAGIIYYDHRHFPTAYRGVFFLNDWLDGTFVYRPAWDGALLRPDGGSLQPFIRRGTGEVLYRPTDLEFGSDGSIYICGWGGGYHYDRNREGSWIFRVTHSEADSSEPAHAEAKRSQPASAWEFDQLVADLGPDALPVWRVTAQDELIRRGAEVRDQLIQSIDSGRLNMGQETWSVWALGRMLPGDSVIEEFMIRSASPGQRYSLNLRLQALRILGHRAARSAPASISDVIRDAVADPDPRVRFEAIQAIRQARAVQFSGAVIDRLADETDRLVFYAGWGTIRELLTVADRKRLLSDQRPRVRLAALLGLQEQYLLTLDEALALAEHESDAEVQSWAMTFAMNPRPPSKMPNTKSRIEMEQSMPIKDLITRADETLDRPVMRQLYLKLISRSPVRKDDWNLISSFYKSLRSDQERALVLVPLTTSLAARDYVWDAFSGEVPLQRAAVDGCRRMVNYSAIAKSSSEPTRARDGMLPQDSGEVTNAEANSSQLTTWILENLARIKPSDARVAVAVEVLADSGISGGWTPPSTAESTLALILEQNSDSLLRSHVLSFIAQINPARLSRQSMLIDVLRSLCQTPDPRLYLSLVHLTGRLELDVNIHRLQAASREGVLSHLENADADHGRKLFFEATDGLGCAACHRVAGRGNDFAPDLSGIGLRAKPDAIVDSILTPSAAITEGYSQQQLITDDGLTITGVVLRETAGELTVFRTDRSQQTVTSQSVVERRKLKLSAMPDGYALFGDEQIADLIAFLTTLKHVPNQQQQAGTTNDR